MLHPVRGSGVIRWLSREQESAAPEVHLAWGLGVLGTRAHCATAPSRAHIQPHHLATVAVAHQLRVCYPENTGAGAFLFVFVLQGEHFMLESCSAAPTHILGRIYSWPAALRKTSAHRNVNSCFSGLILERDEWSTPCQSPSAEMQLSKTAPCGQWMSHTTSVETGASSDMRSCPSLHSAVCLTLFG